MTDVTDPSFNSAFPKRSSEELYVHACWLGLCCVGLLAEPRLLTSCLVKYLGSGAVSSAQELASRGEGANGKLVSTH